MSTLLLLCFSSCSSFSHLLCFQPSWFQCPRTLCQPYCQSLDRRVRRKKPWGTGSLRKPGGFCPGPSSLLEIAAAWESCGTVRGTLHGTQAAVGGVASRNCAANIASRCDTVAEFAEIPCQEEQKRQPREEEVQVTKSKWDYVNNAFSTRYNHLQQSKSRPEIIWFASKDPAGFDTYRSSLVEIHCKHCWKIRFQ